MKKINFGVLILIFAGFLIDSSLYAQEFNIQNSLSTVKWEAKKVVGTGHSGIISVSSGKLSIKEGMITGGKVTIDMNTIVCTDLEGSRKDRLEGHLKSDDFFSVEKHSESSFVLNSAKSTGDSKVKLKGDLSIKGITHPIEFEAQTSEEDGNYLVLGKMEVDRSLYDVKYGSGKFFDNLGDKAINDIFTLEFSLVLRE